MPGELIARGSSPSTRNLWSQLLRRVQTKCRRGSKLGDGLSSVRKNCWTKFHFRQVRKKRTRKTWRAHFILLRDVRCALRASVDRFGAGKLQDVTRPPPNSGTGTDRRGPPYVLRLLIRRVLPKWRLDMTCWQCIPRARRRHARGRVGEFGSKRRVSEHVTVRRRDASESTWMDLQLCSCSVPSASVPA